MSFMVLLHLSVLLSLKLLYFVKIISHRFELCDILCHISEVNTTDFRMHFNIICN